MKIHVAVDHGGLKVNRELAGISQETIAAKTGLDLETIQKYEDESLDLNQASLLTLLKICKALDCEISTILTDPETIDEWEKYIDEDADDEDEKEEFDYDGTTGQSVDELLARVEKVIRTMADEKQE